MISIDGAGVVACGALLENGGKPEGVLLAATF